MAQFRNKDELLDTELAEVGRSIRSSFRTAAASSQRSFSVGSMRYDDDDEYELTWAAIERLPTFERLRTSVFDRRGGDNGTKGQSEKEVIDVTKLGALERHLLVESLIKHIEEDNLRSVRIVYRMTLVLGPPGCGKTTFLLALSGKLDKSLKVSVLWPQWLCPGRICA